MPVTLNTFKSAVQNANEDSFIRMSGSRPGEIVNYGKTLLGRKLGWYRHGTIEQNREVREQLFAALQGEGEKVQAQTLERLRVTLGINEQGQSTKTTQLTAREIKQIIDLVDTDNANVQARRTFANELQQKFPEQQEKISELLGLENPEKMLHPLTEENKTNIRHDLKKNGTEAFTTLFTSMRLPPPEDLDKLTLAPYQITYYKKVLVDGAMKGEFKKSDLNSLKANINASRVKSQKNPAEPQLLEAINKLKTETGVDVTASKDELMKLVVLDACPKANKESHVLTDPDEINALIKSSIETVINKRKELIVGIQNADPKLDPTMAKGLLQLVATDTSLKKASLALCIPHFVSAITDFMEYASSPNPNKEVFAEKLRNLDLAFDVAMKTCREKVGADKFGADDSASLNGWIINLALFCFKEKHGHDPQMDSTLVQVVKQLRADTLYMSANAEEGSDISKPYAYSRDYALIEGTAHFVNLTDSIDRIFHIGLEKENLPPSDGISQDSAEIMVSTEGIARRYSEPFGKVIDQKLSSLFQETILTELSTNGRYSTNEALTDYHEMFAPVIRDLKRGGISLKLGDTVVWYTEQDGMEENAIEKIKAFFDQDATMGLNAARVLGTVLNQTLPNDCLKTLNNTGEGCGGFFTQIKSYAATLNVTRNANGDYSIAFKYDAKPGMRTDREGNLVNLNQGQTHLSFNFKLRLFIDPTSKQAVFQMPMQEAKLHAEIHKSKFTPEETRKIVQLRHPQTNVFLGDQILACPELYGDEQLKALLAPEPPNQQAICDYLKDKILTDTDYDALAAIGMTPMQIKQLSTGLLPGVRLTKALVLRLTGNDASDRQAAFEEIKRLCQRLVDEGWQESAELGDVYDQTLATVGGMKANSKDLGIVRAYIKASQDVGIQTIPRMLASGDEMLVNEAKERLAEIIPQARRAQGVDLLKTFPNQFTHEDIKILREAPDQERVGRHMEAIALRKSEMEASILSLQTYVQALRIMIQEADANA